MCPCLSRCCKVPRPSAQCGVEADRGVDRVSCKRCVSEVLCLVCPLMIVFLWLLSIWKNTRVNKPQYLPARRSLSAPHLAVVMGAAPASSLQRPGPTPWWQEPGLDIHLGLCALLGLQKGSLGLELIGAQARECHPYPAPSQGTPFLDLPSTPPVTAIPAGLQAGIPESS